MKPNSSLHPCVTIYIQVYRNLEGLMRGLRTHVLMLYVKYRISPASRFLEYLYPNKLFKSGMDHRYIARSLVAES